MKFRAPEGETGIAFCGHGYRTDDVATCEAYHARVDLCCRGAYRYVWGGGVEVKSKDVHKHDYELSDGVSVEDLKIKIETHV